MLLSAGLILSLTGGLTSLCVKNIIHCILSKVLPYSPKFIFYEDWRNLPIPAINRINFFDWSNPDDTMKGKSVPRIYEIGPYTFREHQERVNITWNDNDTVTYLNKRTWYFDEELSNGTLEDIVTTLNPVSATIAFISRLHNSFLQRSASMLLSATGQTIAVDKPVRQLLFEGYDDKILYIASNFKLTDSGKIGWMDQVNGTTKLDGVLNVDTGQADIRQLTQVKHWNYADHVNEYSGQCSKLAGTTGEQFHPGLEKTFVTVFSPWICGSVKLDYIGEEEFEGIKGYKYAAGEYSVDNGTKFPENRCRCNGGCFPSGILNVSSCHLDGPVFVSYPHFYKADQYYLRLVEGLRPDAEKHETSVIAEPLTGIIMKITGRLQLNMLVKRNPLIRMYKQVNTTFYPILWIERSIELPPFYVKILKVMVKVPVIVNVLAMLIFFLGLTFLIAAALKAFFAKSKFSPKRHDHSETILNGLSGTNQPLTQGYVIKM